MEVGRGMLCFALGAFALGCGGAEVRPTVIIEEGELIIYDELSSDSLPLDIRFEVDSDVLGEESHRPLEVLAAFVESHSDLNLIEVQGHTDEQGTGEYNMGLSRRRARSVVRFLIAEGVDEDRLRARGFGDNRPVARGNTPRARAQNRRVEFVIVMGQ